MTFISLFNMKPGKITSILLNFPNLPAVKHGDRF